MTEHTQFSWFYQELRWK